jgi:hypothetical protein
MIHAHISLCIYISIYLYIYIYIHVYESIYYKFIRLYCKLILYICTCIHHRCKYIKYSLFNVHCSLDGSSMIHSAWSFGPDEGCSFLWGRRERGATWTRCPSSLLPSLASSTDGGRGGRERERRERENKTGEEIVGNGGEGKRKTSNKKGNKPPVKYSEFWTLTIKLGVAFLTCELCYLLSCTLLNLLWISQRLFMWESR